jgi:hypothetical protein
MRFVQSGDYSGKIKTFLNALITESSKNYSEFKSNMKGVFTFNRETGEQYELDNLVGMKFREGTPLYSEGELNRRGIEIKTPEVLRVLMKWVEELQEIIKDPRGYFSSGILFPNRIKSQESGGLFEAHSAQICHRLSLGTSPFE